MSGQATWLVLGAMGNPLFERVVYDLDFGDGMSLLPWGSVVGGSSAEVSEGIGLSLSI